MKTSSEPARSRPGSSCGDSREDERHPRPHSFNNMCMDCNKRRTHHKSGNLDPQRVTYILQLLLLQTSTEYLAAYLSHDFTSHPSPSRTLNMDEVAQMVCAMNQSVLTQQEQAHIITPPVKLERFDGDFSKFTQFCRTFEWNVESNTNDPRRRLTQLYNQLDGPPKDLIEGCLHLPPDHGYDEAWRMLREEYENSSELLESFISKLFAWKDIEVGDAEGLKKYGSYLFNVEMALGDNICRMELHQARVAEEIRYIEAGRGKPSHTTNKPIIIRKPVNSLNVHALDMNAMDMTPSTSDKCHCCNGQGHKLFACYKFGRKDVDERWDIVTHNKLCFRCLKPGHGHRFCNDKSQCDRCGAYYHHTLLHRPIAKSFAPSRKYKRSPTGSVEVFSNENIPDCYEKLGTPSSSTGGGIEAKGSVTPSVNSPLTDALPCANILDCEPDGRIMMKILPVRVNNSVSTYAFIDGGAAPTLAARSLIQRLGIQGLPVRQAMKTENGIFMCNERVPLMLSSIGGGNNITVNEVYITDKLSITTDSMMPVNWTKKWLHLNDVDLQRLPGDNQEVELIIGLNSILNRHILDQRHGTDDEPSAYLTRFGWVVFGPTGPRNPLTAPVYHISPTQDLGECLREHFNADFWEKEVHSQREDSLEDKLFSDKISQSIHQESGKYVVKLPFRDSSPLSKQS
ncbi:WDFY family member 4 [Penaeus vannamei]|uniref:WDFY family member 4 n=1 Tax=Penaeus vannamei TaxID=6689 RepID=A0A3R7N6W6_PENVA|nr:WDFY family member 4 [Penaeus vannamei]